MAKRSNRIASKLQQCFSLAFLFRSWFLNARCCVLKFVLVCGEVNGAYLLRWLSSLFPDLELTKKYKQADKTSAITNYSFMRQRLFLSFEVESTYVFTWNTQARAPLNSYICLFLIHIGNQKVSLGLRADLID